jgi:hypothetical protein
MELLFVVFVLIGVFVVITAIGLGVSYGIGTVLYDRERPKPDAGDSSPCAQCEADREWYQSMHGPKQLAVTAWWWANRMMWASKGCR